jgi:hypothetical protein
MADREFSVERLAARLEIDILRQAFDIPGDIGPAFGRVKHHADKQNKERRSPVSYRHCPDPVLFAAADYSVSGPACC